VFTKTLLFLLNETFINPCFGTCGGCFVFNSALPLSFQEDQIIRKYTLLCSFLCVSAIIIYRHITEQLSEIKTVKAKLR